MCIRDSYDIDEGFAPGYDRRHYYTWVVEYRPRQSSQTIKNVEVEPRIESAFWCGQGICASVRAEKRLITSSNLKKQDNTIPYRLVGSYEYENALHHLTKLIKNSTPDQIKTYNQLLQKRAEFTFIQSHGLTRDFHADAARIDPANGHKTNDKFKKGGLAWMIALARIELAATQSLYGNQTFPFEVGVTEFEKENYLQLLLGDVAAHMKSLQKEPAFKEVLQKGRIPDSTTVAYLRRLKLIKDMLISLSRASDETMTHQIAPYQKELARHQNYLATSVALSEGQFTWSRIDNPDVIHAGDSNRTPVDCTAELSRLTDAGETSTPSISPLTPTTPNKGDQR